MGFGSNLKDGFDERGKAWHKGHLIYTRASAKSAGNGLKRALNTHTRKNGRRAKANITTSVRGVACGSIGRITGRGHNVERIVVYAGTRNLYRNMKTAVTSLLANNRVDTVYLLIEDDKFPFDMPDNVVQINVRDQVYFPKTGPNYQSK